jgi:hypothetical protein
MWKKSNASFDERTFSRASAFVSLSVARPNVLFYSAILEENGVLLKNLGLSLWLWLPLKIKRLLTVSFCE